MPQCAETAHFRQENIVRAWQSARSGVCVCLHVSARLHVIVWLCCQHVFLLGRQDLAFCGTGRGLELGACSRRLCCQDSSGPLLGRATELLEELCAVHVAPGNRLPQSPHKCGPPLEVLRLCVREPCTGGARALH